MKKLLIFIAAAIAAFQAAQAQHFEGRIEYVQHSNAGTKAFQTYFVNDHFIKTINTDTSADKGHFFRAGFSDLIWDLRKNRQYIINYRNKTVYYYDYEPDSSIEKTGPGAAAEVILGYNCFSYKEEERTPFWFKGKPDTFVTKSIFYIPEKGFTVPLLKSAGKFGSLHFESGHIPLKIRATGGLTVEPDSGYENIIEAASVTKKNIPDRFFKIPKGYILIKYDEEVIKRLVNKAIEEDIDFTEMAKEALRKQGWSEF